MPGRARVAIRPEAFARARRERAPRTGRDTARDDARDRRQLPEPSAILNWLTAWVWYSFRSPLTTGVID
ncbi:hypothetical protein JT30_3641 [Burkholderia pseudomallei]|nr:hypothetical protein JT30_3641 [Burkholderia pseudomallei]